MGLEAEELRIDRAQAGGGHGGASWPMILLDENSVTGAWKT